jgi:hypothetical protein
MTSRLLAKHLDPTTGMFIDLADEHTESMINEKASGMIGAAATNQLLVWARMETEVPKFDDIVADPLADNAKVYIPKRPDAKYLLVYDLAHRVTEKTADAIVNYAMRLPKDMQLVFGHAAVKRNFRLLTTKAFRDKFIPANQSIIALVNLS